MAVGHCIVRSFVTSCECSAGLREYLPPSVVICLMAPVLSHPKGPNRICLWRHIMTLNNALQERSVCPTAGRSARSVPAFQGATCIAKQQKGASPTFNIQPQLSMNHPDHDAFMKEAIALSERSLTGERRRSLRLHHRKGWENSRPGMETRCLASLIQPPTLKSWPFANAAARLGSFELDGCVL
jgi:hypothetical protein